MNEYMIENIAEKRMTKLDKKFLAGEISATAYNIAVKEINEWANRMLERKAFSL